MTWLDIGNRPATTGVSRGRWRRLAALVVVLDLLTVTGLAADGGVGTPTAWAADGGVDPISRLGTAVGGADACPTVPLADGEGDFVMCDDWSAVTTDGSVQVVSVYGDGNPVIDAYAGPLPQSLRWGETIRNVRAALGRPRRITAMYGTPTLVYMFDGERYGSLELQFDSHDRLVRINACLTH